MNKFILIPFIILFIITNSFGQNISETDLIGTWKVKSMSNSIKLTKDEEKQMQALKTAFTKSRFEFKADKHCNFIIEIKDIEIKNGHWKFNKNKNGVVIQEWKDRNLKNSILLEIEIVKKDNQVFFLIAETPIKLEMIKE